MTSCYMPGLSEILSRSIWSKDIKQKLNDHYLGVPHANGNHEEAARKSDTTNYPENGRQISKSQLNRKNKVNMFNLSIIRSLVL